MDCSQTGSSVHGISQARVLEWVVISYSRGLHWPRDQTCVSCVGRQTLYPCAFVCHGFPLVSVSWDKCVCVCVCVCSGGVYMNMLRVSASPLAENWCPVPTNITSSSFVSSEMFCFNWWPREAGSLLSWKTWATKYKLYSPPLTKDVVLYIGS